MGVPARPKTRLPVDEGFGLLGKSGEGKLPGDTPVFRFDAAHPVTGGKQASESGEQAKRPASGAARGGSTPAMIPQSSERRSSQPAATRHSLQPAGSGRRVWARPVPQSTADPDFQEPSPTEVSLTRSLLVFFAGQFTIAGAWFASSFPAFATGVVLTLAGTGWLLRAVQRSSGQGGDESSPVTPPHRPPSRRQSRVVHQRGA